MAMIERNEIQAIFVLLVWHFLLGIQRRVKYFGIAASQFVPQSNQHSLPILKQIAFGHSLS
jgi:hypothetical protein